MSSVRVLVGTRKGAFILTADGAGAGNLEFTAQCAERDICHTRHRSQVEGNVVADVEWKTHIN